MALDDIIKDFRKGVDEADNQAAFSSHRVFVKRVFGLGFGRGQAVRGSLGRYRSESWKKVRRAAGRQITNKDLYFTGALAKSIKPIRNEIRFTDDKLRRIARFQETDKRQVGKPIFSLRKSEINTGLKAYALYLKNNVFK